MSPYLNYFAVHAQSDPLIIEILAWLKVRLSNVWNINETREINKAWRNFNSHFGDKNYRDLIDSYLHTWLCAYSSMHLPYYWRSDRPKCVSGANLSNNINMNEINCRSSYPSIEWFRAGFFRILPSPTLDFPKSTWRQIECK